MHLLVGDEFRLQALSPELQVIITTAVEDAILTRGRWIQTTHLLLASARHATALEEQVLNNCLRDGVRLHHVTEYLTDAVAPAAGRLPAVFTGSLADFSRAARSCLSELDAFVADDADDSEGPLKVPDADRLTAAHLWVATLSHPEPCEEEDLTQLVDVERAVHLFRDLLAPRSPVDLPALYSDDADEMLLLERFDETAIDTLTRAAQLAAELGHERVLPAHLAIALFSRPDGVGEWLVRRQAKPDVGPAKVIAELQANIALGFGGPPRALDLSRRCLGIATQRALEAAATKAMSRDGGGPVDEPSLMHAVLSEEAGKRVEAVLALPTLEIDLQRMLHHLDRYIADSADTGRAAAPTPFQLPRALARSEDLTYRARTDRLPWTLPARRRGDGPAPLEQIKRALHKRENNHVLITGPEGVGKTSLVRGLARSMAAQEIAFLNGKKLLWVDCSEISPEESRDKLDSIRGVVKGRNDVLVCLDGLDSIIRHAGQRESHNLRQLRRALRGRELHLIGIIADRHFHELMASDHDLLKHFTRVEVPEPDPATAVEILHGLRPALADRFGVDIEDEALERAVVLASDFIMSERLPSKAVTVLQDACEFVSYAAAEAAGSHDQGPGRKPQVDVEQVIMAVHERTGVELSVLRGSGDAVDFDAVLRRSVVGQDLAVQAVARELKLIKGGAKDPTKPASIMLFAGLTGTGKTELAKALAQVYSASKKLTVYTMGNFSDSHSVSGIVGVPPGYVGYEMGGRLINDLNADPFSVVLLDEVEKAHPDIWKPFLNLFDEGWMVDQRNVRAYGNRAIFILTANAGAEVISELHAQGADMGTIVDEVKRALYEVEHKTARQKCFTPEFLARITQIVIFNPLSPEAMKAISDLKLRKLTNEWRTKRNKTFDIAPEVSTRIANLGHADNRKAQGLEGGRIVPKHIAALVETPLMDEIAKRSADYQRADTVRIGLDPADRLLVEFLVTGRRTLSEVNDQASARLRFIAGSESGSLVEERLDQVENVLRQWARELGEWARCEGTHLVDRDQVDRLHARVETVRGQLRRQEHDVRAELVREVRDLATHLGGAAVLRPAFDASALNASVSDASTLNASVSDASAPGSSVLGE